MSIDQTKINELLTKGISSPSRLEILMHGKIVHYSCPLLKWILYINKTQVDLYLDMISSKQITFYVSQD